MKKTLITLLAAASSAMGVTLEDAVLTTSNGASMNLDADGMKDFITFTLTMRLDGTALAETIYLTGSLFSNKIIAEMDIHRTSGQALYLGSSVVFGSSTIMNPNYKKAGIFATYGGTSNGSWSTKTYNWKDENSNSVNMFSDILESWGYSYDEETEKSSSNIAEVAYTMTGTAGSEFSAYMTVVLNDGTTYLYSGTTSGYSFSDVDDINSVDFNEDIVKEAYVFDSAVSDSVSAFALNAAVVPEPATSTLSLLALAGLAARRRRR